METYIEGNKAAWEEEFACRNESQDADIAERIKKEDYPFFDKETADALRNMDMEGKTIGHFCCNDGRELLSLVKSGKAGKGIGFDIAENRIAFANEKAKELNLPCSFEAVNIYDIDERFKERFDIVIISVGALCWFDDLNRFFGIVSKCMKPGAVIMLNMHHSCTNMPAAEACDEHDPGNGTECKFSCFEHEPAGNGGMYYMTMKEYHSKTFTDFTHSMSEIMSGMFSNGLILQGKKL